MLLAKMLDTKVKFSGLLAKLQAIYFNCRTFSRKMHFSSRRRLMFTSDPFSAKNERSSMNYCTFHQSFTCICNIFIRKI